MPEMAVVTLESVNELLVAPLIMTPLRNHMNENGPFPEGVVVKVTLAPGHSTTSVSGVLVTFV